MKRKTRERLVWAAKETAGWIGAFAVVGAFCTFLICIMEYVRS